MSFEGDTRNIGFVSRLLRLLKYGEQVESRSVQWITVDEFAMNPDS